LGSIPNTNITSLIYKGAISLVLETKLKVFPTSHGDERGRIPQVDLRVTNKKVEISTGAGNIKSRRGEASDIYRVRMTCVFCSNFRMLPSIRIILAK
jgi:hypothetical protein